ncbi:type IV pilus biogenesis/stability protein PilW [Parachitinimonas caeni]|uniref:Type IV pilus biogenesis/stability protein PilW n=1 Tax=Parachitinimonas caeni TaxID=3031301 RepID=A0ABT7DXE0_9NEIS|nr:type IV pilus biogenesis/stability protein PilW [Parachitinimonas caeni]MDK2123312.1 type IV pilus biogenesis/stability protein PilW [Parachitinimonas caeni]
MRYLPLGIIVCLIAGPVFADKDPKSQERARLRTELAAAYFTRGQFGIALEEIQNALSVDAEYAPAFNVQGLIYSELKEDDKAEESFRKSLQLDAQDSNANHNMAWFLCNKKRKYAEAGVYFRNALKNPLYSTPEKSLYSAGICAARSGEMGEAGDWFSRALRLKPNDPQLLFASAELAYKRQQYELAKQYIGQMGKLTKASPEVMLLHIRVERRLGNKELETALSEQLRRQFPDSSEVKMLNDAQSDQYTSTIK